MWYMIVQAILQTSDELFEGVFEAQWTGSVVWFAGLVGSQPKRGYTIRNLVKPAERKVCVPARSSGPRLCRLPVRRNAATKPTHFGRGTDSAVPS